ICWGTPWPTPAWPRPTGSPIQTSSCPAGSCGCPLRMTPAPTPGQQYGRMSTVSAGEQAPATAPEKRASGSRAGGDKLKSGGRPDDGYVLNRPVPAERGADYVVPGHKPHPPIAAILAIVAVVAQDDVAVGRHHHRAKGAEHGPS